MVVEIVPNESERADTVAVEHWVPVRRWDWEDPNEAAAAAAAGPGPEEVVADQSQKEDTAVHRVAPEVDLVVAADLAMTAAVRGLVAGIQEAFEAGSLVVLEADSQGAVPEAGTLVLVADIPVVDIPGLDIPVAPVEGNQEAHDRVDLLLAGAVKSPKENTRPSNHQDQPRRNFQTCSWQIPTML